MTNDRAFPDHFPAGCPPQDAAPADGVVYRITKNNPPTPEDFLSFYEEGKQLRGNSPVAQCRSRGLSVYREIEDARHQLAALPALGDHIAEGVLTEQHGVTKLTPTKRPTHTTWWCFDRINRHSGFKVINGDEDVESEGEGDSS
jgi:hypothetical protein